MIVYLKQSNPETHKKQQQINCRIIDGLKKSAYDFFSFDQ